MDQLFLDKLQTAGYNKENLIRLMADIDEEKRSVRSALSRLSSEPDHQFAKGKERQVLIRRMKDKMSFLTEQRELVRKRLGEIKINTKALNALVHSRPNNYSNAFVLAAEEVLNESLLLDIEARAAVIAEQLNNS